MDRSVNNVPIAYLAKCCQSAIQGAEHLLGFEIGHDKRRQELKHSLIVVGIDGQNTLVIQQFGHLRAAGFVGTDQADHQPELPDPDQGLGVACLELLEAAGKPGG
jgi:hypothetical protein